MGQSTQDSHLSSSTMKMFVVLAFAALAAAEPEADPALFYSGLTHGYNSMYNTGGSALTPMVAPCGGMLSQPSGMLFQLPLCLPTDPHSTMVTLPTPIRFTRERPKPKLIPLFSTLDSLT